MSGGSARATVVTGRVVRGDGRAAAGAAVFVEPFWKPRRRSDARHERIPPDGFSATSDPEGRFAIRVSGETPRQTSWDRIQIWAECGREVSPKRLLRIATGPLKVPELVLGEGIHLRVRLSDRNGQPVSGAIGEVTALVRDRDGDSEHGLHYWLQDSSDQRGQLGFPPFPRRDDWEVHLQVCHPKGPRQHWALPRESLLRSEDVRVLYLWGLTVRGRIVEPDGTPRADMFVCARAIASDPELDPDREEVRTDSTGVFEVSGVPAEGGAIAIYPVEGFRKGSPIADQLMLANRVPHLIEGITGEEGAAIDLGDVELPRGECIAGSVTDGDGHPIPGAEIWAHRAGMHEGGVAATADGEGRFRIDGLPPALYDLEVRSGGCGELCAEIQGVRSGSEGIVLPLTAIAMLEVQFRDAGCPGESVCLWDPAVDFGPATYGFVGQMSSIRLCLPKGTYDLRITSEQHETAVVKGVAIIPGRETVVDALVVPRGMGGPQSGDPALE